MSLKQEIEIWVDALNHYDNQQFENALSVFDNIADTSKILFNCGVIHATIGEHVRAVECYQRAIGLDQYLAVAYFQQGVSNFLIGDFEEALANFNDTLLYLRGNTYIDYDQLGLKFKLYSCEVLFNRGLCYIYLQQDKSGLQDFGYAVKEKMTPDHDVIDDAIKERAVGYTVFSIPVGVIYRPNEAKVKNLKTKDYLGKARLIATSNVTNISTGFTGAEQKQQQIIEASAKDDRPLEKISYAATNLVQRNLTSRYREQSAAPVMRRNAFPPTPPPETEKQSRTSTGSAVLPTRTSSLRNSNSNRNLPQIPFEDTKAHPVGRSQSLDQDSGNRVASPPQQREYSWSPGDTLPERARIGTIRTASEQPRSNTRQVLLDRSSSQRVAAPPQQLFREVTPQAQQDISPDDPVNTVYSMYSDPRHSTKSQSRRTRDKPQQYLDEEDEYINSTSDETVPAAEVNRSSSRARVVASPPPSKRVEMRKIRVKVHANDETRYILFATPSIDYDGFESKIREKFGVRGKLKIKMRDLDEDSGHMITMADQEDLNVLLSSVKSVARRERNEMGKMEVWIHES